MGEGTKSVRYVSQSLSKSSRTRLLVFSTTFCGASSACACVSMRFFFPLFDAREVGDIVRHLVEELVVEPELDLPLPTVIRLLCSCNIHFLFCFNNYSSMSTWMVATIRACRSMGGGGERRASTWVRGRRRRRAWLLAACHGCRALTAIIIFRCVFVLFEYLRNAWRSRKPVVMQRGVWIQRGVL